MRHQVAKATEKKMETRTRPNLFDHFGNRNTLHTKVHSVLVLALISRCNPGTDPYLEHEV